MGLPPRSDGWRGGTFVGREHELAVLAAAVDGGGSVLVRGAAGLGKTALVERAMPAGSVRCLCRGVAALPTVPYLPLRQSGADLRFSGPSAGVAAQVCRTLGEHGYLVVDDLQWCDPDTLAVVGEVALSARVVATVRGDAEAAADVAATIAETGAVIDLAPLDEPAARRLARWLRPTAPTADVRRWVRAARGVPFDLELLATGRAAGVEGADVAAAAVARLDPPLLASFGRVCLAGTAALLGTDDAEALSRAGLVVHDGAGWRAAHDLLAAAAIARLDDDVRRALHRDLAAAATLDAVRAMHLAEAGDPSAAVRAARRALPGAPTVSARAELLTIVARYRGTPDDLVGAAEACGRAGRYAQAIELVAAAPSSPRAALAEARAQWAISNIEPARAAIERGLGDPSTTDVQRAELLALRSRIRCRVDWDLDGAVADGRAAQAAAVGDSAALTAAHSATGLALLMNGDAGWQDELEQAGRLAVADDDVHDAVTVYDTMFFGHLLSGDPTRCRRLAREMIELTASTSAAWHGYFRAIALIATLHVAGDGAAVVREAQAMAGHPLTVKAAEALRHATALATVDVGRDLDGVAMATTAVAEASDDSARTMAYWALAEASWLSGDAAAAVDAARACLDLGVGGFPGTVNAALIGQWATRALGRPADPMFTAGAQSPFPNLRGASEEAYALGVSGREALDAFERAISSWRGVSRRASLRATWAAGVAAWQLGDAERAITHLTAADREAQRLGIEWARRWVDGALRRAGQPRPHGAAIAAGRQADILERVARGCTTRQVARALDLQPSTVETHVRRAMTAHGARTRLQAAAIVLAQSTGATLRLDVDRAAGSTTLSSSGPAATEVVLADVPPAPWRLDGRRVVGRAERSDQLDAAMLAVLRGAAVRVSVAHCLDDRLDVHLDAVRRAGGIVTVVERTVAPPDLDEQIVAGLVAGRTITEVAAAVGYSRRSLQRRLRLMREAAGVATNREVILALRP